MLIIFIRAWRGQADGRGIYSGTPRLGLCSKTLFLTRCVIWGQSLPLSEPEDILPFSQFRSDFPRLARAGEQATRRNLPLGEGWGAHWGPLAPWSVPSSVMDWAVRRAGVQESPVHPGKGDPDEVPGERD